MESIKLSPKFQIVLPRRLRQAMKLQPGMRLQVLQVEDRIELVPLRDAKSLRGGLAGIDTEVGREDDRV